MAETETTRQLREYANQLRKRLEETEKALRESTPLVKAAKRRWPFGRKDK